MTHPERDQFEPVVDLLEQRLMREVEREQVTKVDLKEYAIGGEHYERLHAQIQLANRFTWPAHLTENF